MCGLVGFIDPTRELGATALREAAAVMARTLRHRGPDDGGEWVDADAGIALGFRRLAIVDLSPEGHQPMRSASGRYVLAFNGEIYNHADLRRELVSGGAAFRGHSDTEVMLAAFDHWGLEEAVRRFVGMFAFALWNRKERVIHLVRDRMGEKPLYYGRASQVLLFGSELKALRAHSAHPRAIDRAALALYMRYGYVPAPHSIDAGIRKLPPGTILTVDGDATGPLPDPRPYWSARQAAEDGAASPFPGSEDEAVQALDELLRDAVGRQMVADVPLGAFLSGGIDSSMIVALMQMQSPRPVKTFTIGFEEVEHDEAQHARRVAQHFGTQHTELYVTPAEAREVIPALPHIYDEPFADSSAIPTYLVARMARRDVTVCLSGDGGDELFCGYPWYPRAEHLWRKIRQVPRPLRQAVARALSVGARGASARFARADRVGRLAELMGWADDPESVHQVLISLWPDATRMVLGMAVPPDDADGWAPVPGLGIAARLMLADQRTYLPGDILAKVDRASMAVSLESRAPLLDHRVVEFAWRVPATLKLRDGRGKWLLRRVLDRYVPRTLIERPKQGFSVPVGAWLRGSLRPWVEAFLDEDRLRRQGFLDPVPVRQAWQEHRSGRHDRSGPLWAVLMFQAWLEGHA